MSRRRTRAMAIAILVALAGLTVPPTSPARALAAGLPVVTSVAPTDVPTAGGTRIVIRGQAFRAVRKVKIGGQLTSFAVVSARKITATAPPLPAGWHPVRVRTKAGLSATSTAARVRYVVPPPPPEPVDRATTLIAEPTSDSAQLTWTLPADERTGLVLRRTTGGIAPRAPTDGTLIATLGPNETAYADSGLTPDTEYSYAVFAQRDVAFSAPTSTSVRTHHVVPAGWGMPTSVLPLSHERIIDCLGPHNCVAVDRLGQFSEYDGAGSAWTKPVQIDTSVRDTVDQAAGFQRLDCASATFCMAIDSAVGSRVFDGTSWAGRVPVYDFTKVRQGPRLLSCGSPTFCVLITTHQLAYVYDGLTWSAGTKVPVPVDTVSYMDHLDCTPSFCMASGAGGELYRFDGTTWSSGQPADGVTYVGYLSCLGTSFCMVLGGGTTVSIWNGTKWTPGPDRLFVPGGTGQDPSFECFNFNYCVYGGTTPQFYLHGSWQSGTLGHNLSEMKCAPGATFCLLPSEPGPDGMYIPFPYEYDNDVTSYDWGGLVSIACATESYCHGIGAGRFIEYDGTDWSAARATPVWRGDGPDGPGLDIVNALGGGSGSVDCASASFCMAGGNAGAHHRAAMARFDGTTWAGVEFAPPDDDSDTLMDVSCPTETFCASTYLYDGKVSFWNGASWSTPERVLPAVGGWSESLLSISCPTTTFCAAAGGYYPNAGVVATWKAGQGWSAPVGGLTGGATSVDCTSPSHCIAVSAGGKASTYDGETWSTPTQLTGGALIAASCRSESSCVAITEQPNAFVYDNGVWSGAQRISPRYRLHGVSCTSASCIVIDERGRTITYTG